MANTRMPKWSLVSTVWCHSVLFMGFTSATIKFGLVSTDTSILCTDTCSRTYRATEWPSTPGRKPTWPASLALIFPIGLAMYAGQISGTRIMQMKIGMVETSYLPSIQLLRTRHTHTPAIIYLLLRSLIITSHSVYQSFRMKMGCIVGVWLSNII